MAQSLAKIYVHAVFSTKNRTPMIQDAWRGELFKVIGATANNLSCPTLLAGGVVDHVHHLFQLGRTISLSEVIGKVKSTSSLWAHQHHTSNFEWQKGYAAFSVSQSSLAAVKQYIATQEERHRKVSFQDELRQWLRQWLRRYDVDWDERYVWD